MNKPMCFNTGETKVVVLGANHHNTYGVIRALGIKGIHPYVILVSKDNNSFLLRSKYIYDSNILKSTEEVIKYLLDKSDELKGSVVIACSDALSSAIDCNCKQLSMYYKLPGSSNQGQITSYMDKDIMSILAREVGLCTPKSWLVSSLSDIDQVEYPCITKPIMSKDGSKTDISICSDKKELENVIKKGSCNRYQVQKFIEKDFEYQLIGCSMGGGNVIIIPGFSRCIRPCPRTNTGFLHYESIQSISAPITNCEEFIRKTGYSGLFSIEFLRDKQGQDYFMEINFRNDGNAICVTASGFNLPYLWYLSNTEGAERVANEVCKLSLHPVDVMAEFADFDNVVRS